MGEQNRDLLALEILKVLLADQTLFFISREELVEVVCMLHVEEAVEEILLQLLISLRHGLVVESLELRFSKAILVNEPVVIFFLHLVPFLLILFDIPCSQDYREE